MKIFLILILATVLNLCATCQVHVGKTYIKSTGFETTKIEFLNDSSFKYYFISCTGGEQGSGNYKIVHSKLSLEFCTKKDTTDYQAKITKTELAGAATTLAIKLWNSKLKRFEKNFIAELSNNMSYDSKDDTILSIKVPNKELPVNIKLLRAPFTTVTVSIDQPGKYEILIPLKSTFMREIDDKTIYKYSILKLSNEQLILQLQGNVKTILLQEETTIKKKKQ